MTPPSTSTISSQYAALGDGFAAAVAQVPADGWEAPSPCPGWTARDVVGHVIGTQRSFLLDREVDLGPALDLADPAAAWARHCDAVTAALADPEVVDREYAGHFGPTTVGATMIRFYGFDLLAHRWDVAAAAGVDWRFTDDELATLDTGADGFGPALYSDGVCKPGVQPPAGADEQTRILAKLGRVAT